MTNTLENLIINHKSTLQRWPQISLLHPNSINLVCDASRVYAHRCNNIDNSALASAYVIYDALTDNFIVNSFKPLTIQSDSIDLSELTSIVVGLENLQFSGIRQPNHTVLNVFTDSKMAISKFMPLFRFIKDLRHNGTPPSSILESMRYSTDIDWLVAYHLIALNLDANIYHLKAHTNNLGYISKDFKMFNNIEVSEDELIYLTSVQAMVDSLATKTCKNI